VAAVRFPGAGARGLACAGPAWRLTPSFVSGDKREGQGRGQAVAQAGNHIEVNGRRYAWPAAPTVVVCIDGSEPAYIEEAVKAGAASFLERVIAQGTDLRADCVVPTFTNPNNLSIVTGRPPSVHGISGNYFLDPETGREVMMNDPKFLRAPTIFQAFEAAGARVAIVTAKDKLRRLLGHGLAFGDSGAVCISAETSDKATLAGNGIEDVNALVGRAVPDVYSAALSEFVFAAAAALMEKARPDILYLSTTDYIQHKHAPGTADANEFYAMMDGYLARLDALGAIIALTADHGMNAKHRADGSPNVIYLQDRLDGWLGAGAARVILPITDPYVVHHGALGSFATIYLSGRADAAGVTEQLRALDGLVCVEDRLAACVAFELPADRVGDLVVVSDRGVVVGTRESDHDLSGLDAPLRSHGGIAEQTVPLILNRPVAGVDPGRRLRNFDAFDLALNHVKPA